MRRFTIVAVSVIAVAACTASPTAVPRQASKSTRSSYTGATDSVTSQMTTEDRNGNTMGSGH